MRKVSEILQQGLNQVKAGHDDAWTGMCIIVSCMVGKGEITYTEAESCEKAIQHGRTVKGLQSFAYLMAALRAKYKLEVGSKQLEALWFKFYEDLIAELKAKGQ